MRVLQVLGSLASLLAATQAVNVPYDPSPYPATGYITAYVFDAQFLSLAHSCI